MGSDTVKAVEALGLAASKEGSDEALEQVEKSTGKVLRCNGTLLVSLVLMDNALREARQVQGYTDAKQSGPQGGADPGK